MVVQRPYHIGYQAVRSFPPDRKRVDIGDDYADFAHVRSLLAWEPKVRLREGLAHTLAFYRQYLRTSSLAIGSLSLLSEAAHRQVGAVRRYL